MKLRPLQILLDAVDRTTAPISKLNTRIEALTAPVKRVNKELDRLDRNLGLSRLRDRAVNVGQSFMALTRRVALFGGALAGAAAIGFNRFLEASGTIVDTADRLGIGIEAFQEYGFVATQNGVKQELFNRSLGTFSKVLGEAKAGQGALFTFLKQTNQGLLRQLLRTRSLEEAFDLVADAIARETDVTKQSALASAAYSRGGLLMVNMLKLGSQEIERQREEARKLGFVLSEETARGAEELGDKIDAAKLVMGGFANTIFSRLLPGVANLVERFNEWARTGEGMRRMQKIGDGLAQGLERFVAWLPGAIEKTSAFVEKIGGIQTIVAAFAAMQLVPLAAALASLATSFFSISAALGIGAAVIAPWLALIAGAGALIALAPTLKKHFGDPGLAQFSGLSGPQSGLAAASGFGSPFTRTPVPAPGPQGAARGRGDVTVRILSEKPTRVERLESEGWVDLFAETGPAMSLP